MNNLIRLQETFKLTPEKMAELFKVDVQEYRTWVTGEDSPTTEQLMQAMVRYHSNGKDNAVSVALVDNLIDSIDDVVAIADVLSKSLAESETSQATVSNLIFKKCNKLKSELVKVFA